MDNSEGLKPGSAPLRSTGELSGERRNVTVLFADISGFTALAEQMDAEEVSRLLNLCFDVLAPVIEKYGGRVDKFIGDEVMALFGAPQAHENDEERALRAALEMMQVLTEFNARCGLDWGLHIGINSGPVIAAEIGSLGQRRYTVIGTAVNLAARLRDLAQRGEILIGADTHHQSSSLFDFDSLEPVSVKGKPGLVQIFRLQGVKAVPQPMRGMPGHSSPLVGRDEELAVMVRASEMLRAGHGNVLYFFGEPGIGKSRLVSSWRAQVARDSGIPALRFAEGRCISYGQQMAYHLLTDLLRSLVGISPFDPMEGSALLHSLVSNLPAQDQDVYPYLAHLLDLEEEEHEYVHGLDPQILQSRYVAALRTVLRAISQRTPLILICEDIHWADPSSIDVLLRLVGLTQEAPILFYFITRPEAGISGNRLFEEAKKLGDQYFQVIRLNALPERESRVLVSNLFGGQLLPESLYSLVLQKAEGNPFFIEEVIHMMLDQGLVEREGGGEWKTQTEITNLQIPSSLQGLLLARIDRLPPEVKRVLQVASVVGRQFDLRVLREGLPDTANLIECLAVLVEAGLLVSILDSGGMEYAFQHNLVSEATYYSMLREDRRRLHLIIGEALESLYPAQCEELAPELARHFSLADELERALEYQLLAGSASLQRYALSEAVAYYQQALSLAKTSERSLNEQIWRKIYLALGRCYELRSHADQAKAIYEEYARLGQELKLPVLELSATIELARVHSLPDLLFDQTKALELINKGLNLASMLDDRLSESRLEWITMLVQWMNGRSDLAILHGERSLMLARQLNAKEQIAFALHDLSRSYITFGRTEDTHRVLAEARSLWEELNNLPMLADCLCSISDTLLVEDRFHEALQIATEAYTLSVAIDNLWNQGYAQALLAECKFNIGLVDEAIDAYFMALALSQKSGLSLLRQRILFDMAQMYVYLGDLEQGQKILEKYCIEYWDGINGAEYTSSDYINEFITLRIMLANQQVAEANELAEKFYGRAENASPSRIHAVEYIRAEIDILTGRLDRAIEGASKIVALKKDKVYRGYETLSAVGLLGRAYLAAGEYKKTRELLLQVDAAAITGESLFIRLNLLNLLAEAEAGLGNMQAAEQARKEAQGLIDFVAEHIANAELKAKFLARIAKN